MKRKEPDFKTTFDLTAIKNPFVALEQKWKSLGSKYKTGPWHQDERFRQLLVSNAEVCLRLLFSLEPIDFVPDDEVVAVSCFGMHLESVSGDFGRLYKAAYSSFESYVKERWGYTRGYAYRLIQFAKDIELSPIGDTPKNEAQARSKRTARKELKPEPSESESGPGTPADDQSRDPELRTRVINALCAPPLLIPKRKACKLVDAAEGDTEAEIIESALRQHGQGKFPGQLPSRPTSPETTKDPAFSQSEVDDHLATQETPALNVVSESEAYVQASNKQSLALQAYIDLVTWGQAPLWSLELAFDRFYRALMTTHLSFGDKDLLHEHIRKGTESKYP